MNRFNRVILLVAVLLIAVFAGSGFAQAQADGTESSFDQKYYNLEYIAYTGIEGVAAQARAVRNTAAFDINFTKTGGIMRNLQAEMEVADALRWEEMAKFYADSGLLTIDPDASTIYRWEALVEYYVTNGLLNDGLEIAAQENANR